MIGNTWSGGYKARPSLKTPERLTASKHKIFEATDNIAEAHGVMNIQMSP